MLTLLALVVFAGLLLYAACTDIASLTIPNWVSVALAASFVVIALAQGMPLEQIGIHVLFGFGILVVGFFMFQAKVFGGGDAKLLAATATWTGYIAFTPFAVGTAIFGGALAAFILIARQWAPAFAPWAPPFVIRLLTPKTGMPYGVAIMLGALMSADTLPLVSGALTLP